MTHTAAQPESADTLSAVLNKLINARSFSGVDISAEREKLAGLSGNFNAAFTPSAEKLADALPKIKDYSARWITARMLRDTGLVSETKGAFALKPLSDLLAVEKDAGMRYMLSDLLRDIGLNHENLAPTATAAIAQTLAAETDTYARSSEAGALLALAAKYESAAPAAMEGVTKVLDANDNPLGRIAYAGKVRDLGRAWPSQADAALNALSQAAEKEKDFAALRQMAQDIAAVALQNPKVAEKAIKILAAGVKRETTNDGVAAYSYALSQMAQAHPLPVIAAINKNYESFGGKEGANKRRMSICILSGLADKGPMESGEASRVLMKALNEEPDAHHRRMIFGGLMDCVRNGVDERTVCQGLKEYLPKERDREAMEVLERSLRSLGYIRPVTNSMILSPGNP